MDELQLTLSNKIQSDLNGELHGDELTNWAKEEYHKLLQGEYLIFRKLALFPFLKILTDSCRQNGAREEELQTILDIVNGKRNYSVHLELGIPPQEQMMHWQNDRLRKGRNSAFAELYEALVSREERRISDRIYAVADLQCGTYHTPPDTVWAYFEQSILRIVRALTNADAFFQDWPQSIRLYCGDKTGASVEEKLLQYLACYMGKRNFPVVISYVDGAPSVSILI